MFQYNELGYIDIGRKKEHYFFFNIGQRR